jgi:hypothetical protein
MPLISKVVVFDLDETLGYFVELSILWDTIQLYLKDKLLGQKDFNAILDLYPEFIKPHIYSILNYLKYKKRTKECNSVMIYTNNQGSKEWTILIKNYFESKIHYALFDQIIKAFKINGKRIEMGRTSNEKTFDDLVKCTKLPKNTQICFLDDVFYPNMTGHNIYYIKVNPYIYNLSYDEMIVRFEKSHIGITLINGSDDFSKFARGNMQLYDFKYVPKSKDEYEIDKIVSKKIMMHLQIFFDKDWYKPPSGTRKNRQYVKRKTLKSRGGFYPM